MATENKDKGQGEAKARAAKSRMPPNEVLDVAGMVRYAEDSIVSRTLVENDAGTITLFAFAAGQGLSEHSTPFDALVEVLDGEGEFTVGGNAHIVAAGQILLMPANVPHAVEAKKPFKMLLTMLRSQ
jgi:quercetin dioxygenase-like cupin family protein